MGNYVRYGDDQIEQANSVPIAEILDAQGEQYKRHGSQYKWMRHDSVIFSGSKWYQYSEARGGRAISFCEAFLDMSFQEAVAYLLRDQGMAEETQTRHESHSPKEETKDQKAQRRLVIPKPNASVLKTEGPKGSGSSNFLRFASVVAVRCPPDIVRPLSVIGW